MLYLNIYLFIELENFLSNLHFDQVDNTFTYFREHGEFYDPGAQLTKAFEL